MPGHNFVCSFANDEDLGWEGGFIAFSFPHPSFANADYKLQSATAIEIKQKENNGAPTLETLGWFQFLEHFTNETTHNLA
mmetsp:Transcript_5266/g.15390  ORF Transcript_5266/g.15390 Transcript_5266/m.15390 type:complete len:80 (+) Transcript_5266:2307-2546(+)